MPVTPVMSLITLVRGERSSQSVPSACAECVQIDIKGSGRLVILAEDDDPTRLAGQAMLEVCQFEVLTANYGLML